MDKGEDLSFLNNFAYGLATYVTLNLALVNLFQAKLHEARIEANMIKNTKNFFSADKEALK